MNQNYLTDVIEGQVTKINGDLKPYETPDYAVFNMADYDPFIGFGELLYGGWIME